LTAHFKQTPPKSTAHAAEEIKFIIGIKPGPTHTLLILKKFEMRLRKGGNLPSKADPDKQNDFVKDKFQPLLDEAEKGK